MDVAKFFGTFEGGICWTSCSCWHQYFAASSMVACHSCIQRAERKVREIPASALNEELSNAAA